MGLGLIELQMMLSNIISLMKRFKDADFTLDKRLSRKYNVYSLTLKKILEQNVQELTNQSKKMLIKTF